MKICIMGRSINLISGHSKPAFELAGELIKNDIGVTILTSRSLPNFEGAYDRVKDYEGFELLTPSNSLMLDLCLARNKTLNAILNSSDIIHLFDYIPPSFIRSRAKKSLPILYTLTGPYRRRISDFIDAGALSFLNLAKPRVFPQTITPNIVFRKVLNSFDKIISTSDYMAKDALALGIARDRIAIIPPWMNIQRFVDTPNNRISDTSESPRFVYFGWGSSIRGVPDVVKAFELVLEKEPKAKLIMCFTGFHGIEEKIYEHLIRRGKTAPSIVLKVGYEADIFQTIRSADVVVLPFRSASGYAQPPLVVLESMALGKPVVSTSIGSIPEIIFDGETGFLVQPRDVKALAQKMFLVSHDKKLSKQIGKQAQEYIMEKHNLESIARKIIEVYKSVAKESYGEI